MSPKPDAGEVARTASRVMATQLDKVMMTGPRGLANALGMIASMVSAVIDRAADRPAAWAYFRRILDVAEKAGTDISQKLDAGEIGIDELAKMAKPEGRG